MSQTDPQNLHERVAAAMMTTVAVGTLNTFSKVLFALRREFPNEDELRAHVKKLEDRLKLSGLTQDYDFLLDCEERAKQQFWKTEADENPG
jgi:hypothetical protein